MNVLLILQARGGSKRFPEKVLKKIQKIPMIMLILNRINKCRSIDKIVVASSENKSSDNLVNLLKKNNIEIYRGSETNVIKRYYNLGKKFNPKYIVRITADCPLVNSKLIDKFVNFIIKKKYDYVSNVIKRSYPKGLDIEVFKLTLLNKIYRSKKNRKIIEHVTPSMINSKKIKKYNFLAKKNFSTVNVSVDYPQDLVFVKKIYKKYGLYNSSVNELFKTITELKRV